MSDQNDFRATIAKRNAELKEASKLFVEGIFDGDYLTWYQGFHIVQQHTDMMSRAMRRAIRNRRTSDEFRRRFLEAWLDFGDCFRDTSGQDLLLVEFLKIVLPTYSGPQRVLYRGEGADNRRRRTYGMSWTSSREVAEAFASDQHHNYQQAGLVLEAIAPAAAIVCAPGEINNRYDEHEYIVDRRLLLTVRVIQRVDAVDPQTSSDAHRSTPSK